MKKNTVFLLLMAALVQVVLFSSCANIIPPVGGPRDSLPPVLIRSLPADKSRNFTGNRITISFDEYVEVTNTYQNVLISPVQETFPIIDYKLRNVTIRLKDTLQPNTTYAINFGNSIKDVNEGNIYKDFTYVFSTGNTLDSLSVEGSVKVAETNSVDSTLIVGLYKNLDDSAVVKEKPKYMARVDGKGHFKFDYLPKGVFRIVAFKDEGFKKYSDNSILFAFADAPINTGEENKPIELNAFVGEKREARGTSTTRPKEDKDKKLTFQINLDASQQDLLKDMQVVFSKPLKQIDSAKFLLVDTLYDPIKNYTLELDTSKTRVTVKYPWKQGQTFRLMLPKDAVKDTSGNGLAKNDTIRFKTRSEDSYGQVRIKFTGLDMSKHPVLQWIQNDVIFKSFPLASPNGTPNFLIPAPVTRSVSCTIKTKTAYGIPVISGKRYSPKKYWP